jgi:ABC-2 type transport system permease protein
MRAAVRISLKDLKARIRDRSALLIGILVPLGLAFIFNSIFSGISGDSKAINFGVVDLDRGPVARVFVEQVLGAVEGNGLIAVHSEQTVAGARALAAKGTLNAVIVIPAGFSDRVQANRPVSMQVIGNVDSPISAEVARSVAEGYASDLNRVRLSVATVVRGPGGSGAVAPEKLRALVARAAAAEAPVAVRDISAVSKPLDQKSFFAAGMAVFFLFFTVQFGVTSLLEERNEGTLARLLAAPITRASILGGKLLTSFLLGVLSMAVLVIATSLLFGASWGEPAGRGGGDPVGHGHHGPDRHPGQERGAGRQLAIGRRGHPRPARRDVLPRLPGARHPVQAHLRGITGMVPSWAGRPSGRRHLHGVDVGAGDARVRRGGGWNRDDPAQAHLGSADVMVL